MIKKIYKNILEKHNFNELVKKINIDDIHYDLENNYKNGISIYSFKKNILSVVNNVDNFLLMKISPYTLVFNKTDNFLEYKESKKEYFEKYESFLSQENDIFYTFPFGMCRYSINDFIKNEDKLIYGEDYIAIGALEGIFYKDKILENSNILKIKLNFTVRDFSLFSINFIPQLYNPLVEH